MLMREIPERHFHARHTYAHLPLLLQICIAGALASVMVTLSYFVGQHKVQQVEDVAVRMQHDARGRCANVSRSVLPGHVFYPLCVEAIFFIRHHLQDLKIFGFWEMLVYRDRARKMLVHREKGRHRLEPPVEGGWICLMPWPPAITDIEQLKNRPEAALLLPQYGCRRRREVRSQRADHLIERTCIRDACQTLKDSVQPVTTLMDVTCVDWYPNSPRFEVVYHLFST